MRLESPTSFDLLGLISLAEPDSPRSTHNLYKFGMPTCGYHHHEHTNKYISVRPSFTASIVVLLLHSEAN
jgi:hypothetical protein